MSARIARALDRKGNAMVLAPALTASNNTLIGVAVVIGIICMLFWLFRGRR